MKEKEILTQIDPEKLPSHVAIIMDGNGRWAKKRDLPRIAGHRAGRKTVKMVVKTSAELGIKFLTLYAFSRENWQRPREEVEGLMRLLSRAIKEEIADLHKNKIKVQFIGRIRELSSGLQAQINQAMDLTSNNQRMVLTIAINYSGRIEIVDALKMIIKAVEKEEIGLDEITELTLDEYLYARGTPDPDLLIRTGGEMRLSNFLLWQIAYTELWVTPILWPDFKKVNFLEAIRDYEMRERRFGRAE